MHLHVEVGTMVLVVLFWFTKGVPTSMNTTFGIHRPLKDTTPRSCGVKHGFTLAIPYFGSDVAGTEKTAIMNAMNRKTSHTAEDSSF